MADQRLTGPSILALVGDHTGPTLWRCLWPITALEKAGYPCGWDDMANPAIGQIAPAFDGYLLARTSWNPEHRRLAEQWFASIRRAGKFVVYDADDDIFTAAETHRRIDLDWTDGKSFEQLEEERFQRIWAMQQCDGVTVSTQRLATIVRSFTSKPVVVVPNAIDLPWFRGVVSATRRRTKGPTIGWAGGRRHDRDVEDMATAWGRIAHRYPDVRFVCQGWQPEVIRENVPADRLVQIPWLPLEQYPAGLREVDIACCALADVPFNRAKCVHSSMRITTSRGVIEAGAITPGMRVWRGAWRMVEAVKHDVPCPGIQITTRSGYRLKLTPEHRMMANGDWKRAEEIVPGDCMLMEPEAIAVRDLVRVNWPSDSRMSRAGGRETFDPRAFLAATDGPKLDVSVRWGRFLGAWAGDGSCGQSTVAEIACDGQDQDWIDLLMADLRAFGLNPMTEQHTMYDGTPLRRRGIKTASAHLLRVLESLGVATTRENGRPIRVPCVPEVIWRSPKPVIAEFLAGYFEADGTCTSSGLSVTSKHEALLRDVQRLLLLFGITSRLRHRKATAQNGFSGWYWMLIMRRPEADIFAREIGFRSVRKRARLAEITNKSHSNAWKPITWEDEVTEVAPCMVAPVDIQVEGETFVLAGFVSHNSNIKAMEAAAAGAAVVASPLLYSGLVDHGYSGWIANDAGEWEDALSELIEKPALRSMMARRLLKTVERKHSLRVNLWRWPVAWSQIAETARTGRLVAV